MTKKKLPKGIRKKGNAYEGRASIRGEMVYAYDKTAYARAYREIYSEIQNLINSK